MRKICVINQKGGVGKTTTTVNIAAGLSRKNKKVLIVDLDPQGNIGSSLKNEGQKNIFHVLTENADIRECVEHMGENLDIIFSDERLAETERFMASSPKKELFLKDKLKELSGYDYIILDCPPSQGLLSLNALLYAQEAFIPVSTDYLGYDALKKMTKGINKINKEFNHDINITKIIPTMFDKRNKICKRYLDKITSEFYELTTISIRINSKLKEAPEQGKSIFSYDKSSRGAKDYLSLVNNILHEEEKMLSSYMYAEDSEEENLIAINDPAITEKLKGQKSTT